MFESIILQNVIFRDNYRI